MCTPPLNVLSVSNNIIPYPLSKIELYVIFISDEFIKVIAARLFLNVRLVIVIFLEEINAT